MSTDEREQFAILVTRPDNEDRPEGVDLVVRVGPYHYRHIVESVAHHLRNSDHSRSRPEGTTIEIAPYDESLPHRPTLAHADTQEVMEVILAEGNAYGEWSFPDSWDLLRGAHTYEAALSLHQGACAYLDAEAEAAEQAEREAAERVAALRDEAERLDPCVFLIKEAAGRRVEETDTKVVHQAAGLLADLLDVTDRHQVDRGDACRLLPGPALDAIVSRPAAAKQPATV